MDFKGGGNFRKALLLNLPGPSQLLHTENNHSKSHTSYNDEKARLLGKTCLQQVYIREDNETTQSI